MNEGDEEVLCDCRVEVARFRKMRLESQPSYLEDHTRIPLYWPEYVPTLRTFLLCYKYSYQNNT